MKESKEEKKQRALKILSILKNKYPFATTALKFNSPFELLAATILSAQCTDKRVNEVTEKLFKKYKSIEDFANANEEEFANEIKSTGYYKQKAKSILGAAKRIVNEFNGEFPFDFEKLTSFPGVGRKTANLILAVCSNRPAIIVDTHVRRVANILKLAENEEPFEIEMQLMEILPKEEWSDFSHRLIFHGREICNARKPKCSLCEISMYCPSKK